MDDLGFQLEYPLLIVQIICLQFGQFAKSISLPQSSTVRVMSILLR